MTGAAQTWDALRALLSARHGQPPPAPAPRDQPLPASFGQERFWVLDRWHPGGTAYNLSVAVELAGALDVKALRRAFMEVVHRHEVLRTTLARQDGGVIQRVHPLDAIAPSVALAIDDVPTETRDQWAAAHAATPFDLQVGPLLRARLGRMAPCLHCLVISVHHAIFDLWSFELLMAELGALYGAFCQGPSAAGVAEAVASGTTPALQYADFAVWQRQRARGPAHDAALAHWTRHLAGDLPALQLPQDHPRAPPGAISRQPRGASQRITLPGSLLRHLEGLAAQEGTTLFVLLLAALAVLLHRHTGQEDLVIATPFAGRDRAPLDRMLGLFVNTLALRTDLSGDPPFRELLARMREVVAGALAHPQVPFEQVVKAVRRQGRANPELTRVLFAFQNVPRSGWAFPGLMARAWNVEPAHAKADLAFTAQTDEEGQAGEAVLRILLEYDAELFEPTTAARLLSRWGALLAGIVAEPGQRIGELPVLDERERICLVEEWSGARSAGPAALGDMTVTTVEGIFERHARESPDAIAILSDTGTMTYAAVDGAANRLARRLAWLLPQRAPGNEAEATPGEEPLVGIVLPRSSDLVVAQLAILKAGAAFVPLDPAAPGPYLSALSRKLAAVVSNEAHAALASSLARPVLSIDGPARPPQASERHDGPPPRSPSNGASERLAYVMFTSGSTGAPRGVCIPHRGIVRLVVGASYVRLDRDQVLLHLAPPAFDAATFEVWGALLNGARLVLAPARPLSLGEIGGLVRAHGVTTLWLTAGLFERLVDGPLDSLGSVAQLVTGGDVMSAAHAARFKRRWPACRLVNGYGPTENTTFTTTHVVETEAALEAMAAPEGVPIGRPIRGTSVYVLDARRAPVPIGVVGEAYAGGAGLARGYLSDDTATREHFVPSPFDPATRLYRTGDLVRWRADGTLAFVGRTDAQIKLRGFRIEPAEIEKALQASPDVARALVRAERDAAHGASGKELVAYIVTVTGERDVEALYLRLEAFLRERLPSYLLPSRLVVVDDLPLTANGKRERAAVELNGRAIARRRPGPSVASRGVAPRDPWEQRVAALFERALRREDVGVHDDFFGLGGDSLSALALVSDLERHLVRPVPLATLFQHPTVAALADALRDSLDVPPALGPGLALIKAGRHAEGARPLFLAPGGRGGKAELLICAKLVSRLDTAETVLGLLPTTGEADVEATAADHLASVRRVQPHGPYRLGGQCIGGLVAWEMAQQLRAHGEEIELLVLLETWCPTSKGVLHHDVIGQPRALVKAGLAFLQTLPTRAPDAEPWLAELLRRAITPPDARRRIRACHRYRPDPYPGRVVLFASEDSLRRDIARPWRALSPALAIHPVPGDHESYSRQHYRAAAEQVRAVLDRETPAPQPAQGGIA